jgi:hypothetical protein
LDLHSSYVRRMRRSFPHVISLDVLSLDDLLLHASGSKPDYKHNVELSPVLVHEAGAR